MDPYVVFDYIAEGYFGDVFVEADIMSAFPTIGAPARLSWRLISNTQIGLSPLSKVSQTYELPGARWGFTAEWPPLENVGTASRRRSLMRAFLVGLGGEGGRFDAYNWESPTPGGTALVAAGSPTGPFVSGASQTGVTLVTRGWTPSSTGVLLPGDYFSVNGELKMVMAQANSDGSGNSTLSFRPPLRTSPANSAPIALTQPTATFMLTSDTVEWSVEAGNLFADFMIDAVEVF